MPLLFGTYPLTLLVGGLSSHNIIVYQYPFEGNDFLVENYFTQYREVHAASKQKYADLHSVSMGARIKK